MEASQLGTKQTEKEEPTEVAVTKNDWLVRLVIEPRQCAAMPCCDLAMELEITKAQKL